jgi:hypothetical protein
MPGGWAMLAEWIRHTLTRHRQFRGEGFAATRHRCGVWLDDIEDRHAARYGDHTCMTPPIKDLPAHSGVTGSTKVSHWSWTVQRAYSMRWVGREYRGTAGVGVPKMPGKGKFLGRAQWYVLESRPKTRALYKTGISEIHHHIIRNESILHLFLLFQ